MRRFSQLLVELEASADDATLLAATKAYLTSTDPVDAAWAVYLLAGARPRRPFTQAALRQVALQACGLPDWLFEQCRQAVGDLAETISLVLPDPLGERPEAGLHVWMGERLWPLHRASPGDRADMLCQWWRELALDERFFLTRLVCGSLHASLSRRLLQRALADHAGVDTTLMAERLAGYAGATHPPDVAQLQALLAPAAHATAAWAGQPFGFCRPRALPATSADGPEWQATRQRFGQLQQWQAEWRYPGQRAQLVRQAGQVWLWSPEDELLTDRFPEVAAAAMAMPDGVVFDGVLLVWPDGQAAPAPRTQLQERLPQQPAQRLKSTSLSKKLLADSPAVFMAFDLLAIDGADIRGQSLHQRRSRLHKLLSPLARGALQCAPTLVASDWAALEKQRALAREQGMAGLVLKPWASRYTDSVAPSDALGDPGWWCWAPDPLQLDGVLVYAQTRRDRRADPHDDYTVALWNRKPRDADEVQAAVQAIVERMPPPGELQLVPIAKVSGGLGDGDMQALAKLLRSSTVHKFGPVRSLRPSVVVRLAFDGLERNARRKSGFLLRSPCLLRCLPQADLFDVSTLVDLATWGLPATESGGTAALESR